MFVVQKIHRCSAARICAMTAMLIVFIVFASMSGNESSTSEFRSSSGQAHTKTIGSNRAVNYDNYEWKELPKPVKKAASRLGYTQRSWDHSVNYSPPIFNKQWKKLMTEEKRAATALGYNEKSWSDELNGGAPPATVKAKPMPKRTAPPTSEDTSEGTSEDTSEDTSEGTSADTSGDTSEDTSEDASEDTSESGSSSSSSDE